MVKCSLWGYPQFITNSLQLFVKIFRIVAQKHVKKNCAEMYCARHKFVKSTAVHWTDINGCAKFILSIVDRMSTKYCRSLRLSHALMFAFFFRFFFMKIHKIVYCIHLFISAAAAGGFQWKGADNTNNSLYCSSPTFHIYTRMVMDDS